MELRPGLSFKPQEFNVCSNFGGMGDMIARLPAIKYIHDNFRHVSMNVFWHDYFVELAEFLLPSSPRLVHWKFSEMDNANKLQPLVTFDPNRVHSWSMHLTDLAWVILLDRLPSNKIDKRYIKAPSAFDAIYGTELERLKTPYVILTCGYTAPTRQWLPQYINETARELKSLGYTPVFLGSPDPKELGNNHQIQARFSTEVDYSLGINLIGKTSLVEALGIIQGAKAIMGVDNGLLHLASCTETPVIWGFTSLEPYRRLPVSNGPQAHIFPSRKKVPCRGCQSRVFYVHHDWRKCPFGDYQCLHEMTSKRFISSFKRLLKLP